jgi:hypothetical protein
LVLLIILDMCDVCVSSGREWGKSALYCAEKWRVRMLYGLDSLARLPVERGLVIKFESLLHDREAVAGALRPPSSFP